MIYCFVYSLCTLHWCSINSRRPFSGQPNRRWSWERGSSCQTHLLHHSGKTSMYLSFTHTHTYTYYKTLSEMVSKHRSINDVPQVKLRIWHLYIDNEMSHHLVLCNYAWSIKPFICIVYNIFQIIQWLHMNCVVFFVAGCWQIHLGQTTCRVLEVYLNWW